MIAEKKKKIVLAERQRAAHTQDRGAGSSGFSFSALFGGASSGGNSAAVLLRGDVCGLSTLAQQLYMEVLEARREQARAKRALTFAGRYFNILGYGLSAYCAYRIVLVCNLRRAYSPSSLPH